MPQKSRRHKRPQHYRSSDGKEYIIVEKKAKSSGYIGLAKLSLIMAIMLLAWYAYAARYDIYNSVAPIFRNVGSTIALISILAVILGHVGSSNKLTSYGYIFVVVGALLAGLPYI